MWAPSKMPQSPEGCFKLNPSCDSESHSRIHINVWITLEASCAIAGGEKLRTNALCSGGNHEPYQSIRVKSRGNPQSGAKCKGSDRPTSWRLARACEHFWSQRCWTENQFLPLSALWSVCGFPIAIGSRHFGNCIPPARQSGKGWQGGLKYWVMRIINQGSSSEFLFGVGVFFVTEIKIF